ncbi:DUF2505 domain-containing protein [Pseudonocardia kujensis]|uniref:DUF2505 domain-containing protein n=1 Tax=Pseudonocardia kujensis TaxID=1128675 RepID=UPI001E56C61D|nr:DUF2505 domain-containing protein [Pseudonocardia kujensis]MCE0767478.1 DUF2505 domain-containing protein [Pseudonocardia kujensis]
MSRPTEFRATSPHPVDRVYAALVDRQILSDRLATMGGPGAAILEYTGDENGCKYRIRHGIDEKDLPGVVKSFVGSRGITIERDESWTRSGDGYDGTVGVELPGMPAGAQGTMRLAPKGEGSELVVNVDVTVKVPILGGKIEESVAQQIHRLLEMETEYTLSRI